MWVHNLTDERYFRDLAPIASGVRANYADPRTFGVEFKYTY